MKLFYFFLFLLLTPTLFAQTAKKGFDSELFDKVFQQLKDEIDEDAFVEQYPDAKKYVLEDKEINVYQTGSLIYNFHDEDLFWISFHFTKDEWKENGGIDGLDAFMSQKMDGEKYEEWEYHKYNWGNAEYLVVCNNKPDDKGRYWFALIKPVDYLENVFLD